MSSTETFLRIFFIRNAQSVNEMILMNKSYGQPNITGFSYQPDDTLSPFGLQQSKRFGKKYKA